MHIEVRLKRVLQEHGLDDRGVTQRIADAIKVHRHTIGKLYRNQATHPSLEVLGKVCVWLQENGVPATALPHSLFGTRPSGLCGAIAASGFVTLYVGEYHQVAPKTRTWRWVAQHDALAMSKVVQSLSAARGHADRPVQVRMRYIPFRFEQQKQGPRKAHLDEDARYAKEVFERMRSGGRSHSAILIGSQRANLLLEIFVADLFGCARFQSPGKISTCVPFYLLYRADDRHVPSCFGGHDLPPGCRTAKKPGIYYLTKEGWVGCPKIPNEEDAGIVIVSRDAGTSSCEMAFFGFSGAATEALSELLLDNPDRFWPPAIEANGRQVGVYICRFGLSEERPTPRPGESNAKLIETIPLPREVIEGRINQKRS